MKNFDKHKKFNSNFQCRTTPKQNITGLGTMDIVQELVVRLRGVDE